MTRMSAEQRKPHQPPNAKKAESPSFFGSASIGVDGLRFSYEITQELKNTFAANPEFTRKAAAGELSVLSPPPADVPPEVWSAVEQAYVRIWTHAARAFLDPTYQEQMFPKRKPTSASGKRLYNASRRNAKIQSATTRLAVQDAMRAVVEEGQEPPGRYDLSTSDELPPTDEEQLILDALDEAAGPLLLKQLARAIDPHSRTGDEKTLTSRAIPVLKRRGWIVNIPRRGYSITEAGVKAAKQIRDESLRAPSMRRP